MTEDSEGQTRQLDNWHCVTCGWSGVADWDEYESKRICPDCGADVIRDHQVIDDD